MRTLIIVLSLTVMGCVAPPPPEPEPLPPPAPRQAPPRIAYMDGGNMWTVDPDRRDPRLWVEGLEYDRPLTWSPDGQTLLFWKHSEIGWDIWAIDANGENPRNLTNVTSGGCRSPSWSPDGSQIAFMRDDPPGLYVMDAGGQNARRISELGHRDEVPAWSPDGAQIVFGHLGRGDDQAIRMQLVMVNLDGTGERQLATPGPADSPHWSDNGRWILFSGRRDGNQEICIIHDLETGEEVNLTQSPGQEFYPAWSAGGTIACIRVLGEERELVVMDAAGTNPRVLLSFRGRGGRPSWSPDGSRIAISIQPPDEPARVFVVGVDGGDPYEIARGSQPAWQPRGTLLPPEPAPAPTSPKPSTRAAESTPRG